MTKLIVNVETNEITERELNKAEKDQEKIDAKNFEKLQAEIQAQTDSKAAQRQVILDRLGLTAEEAKLILG